MSDAILILRQVIEKHREFNILTHIASIDFGKAFDNLNRAKLSTVLKNRGYLWHLIRVHSL